MEIKKVIDLRTGEERDIGGGSSGGSKLYRHNITIRGNTTNVAFENEYIPIFNASCILTRSTPLTREDLFNYLETLPKFTSGKLPFKFESNLVYYWQYSYYGGLNIAVSYQSLIALDNYKNITVQMSLDQLKSFISEEMVSGNLYATFEDKVTEITENIA